ncbi:tRNA guanosine(34) transglycosylase Tgt [uncultured Actinomyces sp.]|uniref:tRNA guanosine(34) transglycosylase Tgt n=1 Tax=uncultured Actinomyces sp. TaxID=249061 RepID=UPI002607A764|nr:tRNA guanosine(34) transglycosylase Tgt [uncultured Actinomyces sp.]
MSNAPITQAHRERIEASRGFEVEAWLNEVQVETDDGPRPLGRVGTLQTAHGTIETPAFIPVGTLANVKGVLPEMMKELGAQALLANAYHLYLQPGADIVEAGGGLGRFMNWAGPTFTDSGGFQVLSLGSNYKKVLSQEFAGKKVTAEDEAAEAVRRNRAAVDEDGVVFRSHIDGTKHRFNPEISLSIQHQLGADIMFAFDELTSLLHPYDYQVESLARTHRWAQRSLDQHWRLTAENPDKPYQQLYGVLQGAQYKDLRNEAARTLTEMRTSVDLEQLGIDSEGFDGFGLGGALEKENLGLIVSWLTSALPDSKPRHLLGISEPDDFFAAIEAGADTFDCVNPSRVARNAAIYTPYGRVNITNARFKRDFGPLANGCGCYTCQNYSTAYVHHLFKAHEILAATLATIHNEWFTVHLVDNIRESIRNGDYTEYKQETLARFYGN